MKTYLTAVFASLTAFGMVSCAAPYDDGDDDDDDGGHVQSVTTERIGVDPYTGIPQSEVTTRVVRHED